MGFYALSALINGLSSSALGIFVYLKNRKGNVNRTYGLTTIFIGIWSYSYFFWQIAINKSSALFWCRALMGGAIFISPAYLHFVLTLLGLHKKKKKMVVSSYIFGSIFFILNFTPLFVKDVSAKLFFKYWPNAGVTYLPFLFLYSFCAIYAIVVMAREQKQMGGINQLQIRYVILGAFLGFSGGSTNYPLWYNIPIPPIGNILVSVGIAVMAYAIVKYRLMDIKIAITRAGIFVVVYTLVLGIPFGLAGWGRVWLMAIFGQGWFWIPMIILLGLATSGPFIFLFLQHKAENRLLREQRYRQEVVIRASETFTLIKRLSRLLRYIGVLVTTALKIDYAAIFLFDKRNSNYVLSNLRGRFHLTNPIIPVDAPLIKYLQHTRNLILYEELKERLVNPNLKSNVTEIESFMRNISSHLIVPSFIKAKLVGFMILGNKTSGEIYTSDDIATFKIMARSAALAIEYAQFLKEYEEAQAKLREAEKLKGISQLMYSLNHELLNAFNLILPPVEMLLMGLYKDNKEKTDELLTTIQKGINRCMRVLNDIKSFRYKSASDIIRPRSIEELTHSAISKFSGEIQQENIQLNLNIEPNLPLIDGKDTFEDLPYNIISNSVYALEVKPRERRFLNIHIYLSEDKRHIIFKTEDTGADITKDADTHDTGSPFKERANMGGVNLGIAHLIVNGHNGTLELNSYEKCGTTFIITLPISQENP
ncbi:MAG: hypothetical protein NC828_02570 [Candidatus Omnitrophica bacterium]|nr:hypothetical protein [Candidatus Omnitrophota bacterium]